MLRSEPGRDDGGIKPVQVAARAPVAGQSQVEVVYRVCVLQTGVLVGQAVDGTDPLKEQVGGKRAGWLFLLLQPFSSRQVGRRGCRRELCVQFMAWMCQDFDLSSLFGLMRNGRFQIDFSRTLALVDL